MGLGGVIMATKIATKTSASTVKASVKTVPENASTVKAAPDKSSADHKAAEKKVPAESSVTEDKKVESKTTEVKAAAKKAAKPAATKKPAVKKEIKVKTVVEYYGKQVDEKDILANVKKAWTKSGKKVGDIKSVELYIKPEEAAVYYVINKTETGAVAF